MGIFYRGKQFWASLSAKPSRDGMAEAKEILPSTLYALFTRLQPSEKAHAIAVLQKVRAETDDPDLLAAALLHDIGKIIVPLKAWERVLIVLAGRGKARKVIEPLVDEPADAKPTGWSRALVVADKHPIWGAQLARKAGAGQTVIRLIRRHQDRLAGEPQSHEDRLLQILQAADDRS